MAFLCFSMWFTYFYIILLTKPKVLLYFTFIFICNRRLQHSTTTFKLWCTKKSGVVSQQVVHLMHHNMLHLCTAASQPKVMMQQKKKQILCVVVVHLHVVVQSTTSSLYFHLLAVGQQYTAKRSAQHHNLRLWCFHCEFQCSWKLHWCEICRWKLQISQG